MRPFANFRRRHQPGLKLYYASPWVKRSFRSDRRIIIAGGCERSGTTLLRAALDSHPDVAAGPEAWVFVYRLKDMAMLASDYGIAQPDLLAMKTASASLGEFVDRLASRYTENQGKSVWCEKSPQNIFRLDYIWDRFPNARVVHIIRDGRDVSCSLRTHPRHRLVDGEYVPTNIRNPIGDCIDKWVAAVSAGIRHRGDERYMEIRYEDLIHDYAEQARRICDHTGLEWKPEMLDREGSQANKSFTEIVNPEVRNPLTTKAIGRWRQDLKAEELSLIRQRAGDLLSSLGYSDEPEPSSERLEAVDTTDPLGTH